MPSDNAETTIVAKRKRRKPLAGWIALGFFVALWIFVVFFLDSIIGNFARKELIKQTASATHNEYQLSFTSFRYHRGSILARGMVLARNGYRPSEHGTTLRELSLDSARVSGICWWNILFGSTIELSDLHSYGTSVHLCNADEERAQTKKILPDTVPKSTNSSRFALQFNSVEIPGVSLFGRRSSADYAAGEFTFTCNGFSYDSKSAAPLHMAVKKFQLQVPWVNYADASGSYYVRNASTSSTDALAIDTFAYASGENTLAFSASQFHVNGIDLLHNLSSKRISFRLISTRTWSVRCRIEPGDTTKPRTNGTWQEKLAHSLGLAIAIDSIRLNGGTLDLQIEPHSSLEASALDLHARHFNLDSGSAAVRPCFSDQFALAAREARYTTNGTDVGVTQLTANISDSLMTASRVLYASGEGSHSFTNRHSMQQEKAPMSVRALRAEGVRFRELLNGQEIAMTSLRAAAWNVSGLPQSTGTKHSAKKSKTTKSANSIWEAQKQIAESISIPIRIGRIDLQDGTMHVKGGTNPTIDAERAGIQAVGFDLDTTRSTSLFFSKDLRLGAGTFHFADWKQRNILDAKNARTRLSSRSLAASSITFVSRSPFEPDLNNSAYTANDLDLKGIDFEGLFDNKQILVEDARMSSWKIERKSDTVSNPEKPIEKAIKPEWKLPIRVRHAALPNGTVLFWEPDTVPGRFAQTLKSSITTLEVNHFHFLPPHKKRPRIGYRQVICAIPSFTYTPLDGFYHVVIRNLNANLADSTIAMDSLGYIPLYSEDSFAAMHKYARGRTDFRLASARLDGIDARRLINGGGVIIDSFAAPTLWLDYYKDDRKPSDPNPSPAVMPNDLVRSVNLPFTLQHIAIAQGHIQIREHDKNEDSTGYFTFDSVKISASPLTLDSASPEIDTPTHIEMDGIFIAQSLMRVAMDYPLHDTAFNLSLIGKVGPFDLKQLNSYLIPGERVQVMNGNFYDGTIQMKIANDVATTYVCPIYNHFKLRMLPPKPDERRGVMERLKTFVADNFILRDDDPDEKGGPPITATTTLARKGNDEYFKFLWMAIRQSLGKVVGGFK
ncbi:MAG TPA: hypothetical protein VGM92_04590 [Candidatus Kapabacteria bacterium]|jgi:hypothetical protein